jgi:hypothetical protein
VLISDTAHLVLLNGSLIVSNLKFHGTKVGFIAPGDVALFE